MKVYQVFFKNAAQENQLERTFETEKQAQDYIYFLGNENPSETGYWTAKELEVEEDEEILSPQEDLHDWISRNGELAIMEEILRILENEYEEYLACGEKFDLSNEVDRCILGGLYPVK